MRYAISTSQAIPIHRNQNAVLRLTGPSGLSVRIMPEHRSPAITVTSQCLACMALNF
jgi:hypothetical protein